ncbi:hypothetical protein [Azospirillum rugosum]|uniref:TrbL/VirB6 plasmid conjugal transfer protein n=1 Tax=Azospirillum rugosum TaxID=416170 RepID=A0ABS4SWA3_9PROT|nr:hypothetical protein [Azospirillum rugosum]MBP2296348.1 hypothetical protein [Azospirillum rugosum]MDQ0529869.1 hypothetical protein [Azospirillum rugosum]
MSARSVRKFFAKFGKSLLICAVILAGVVGIWDLLVNSSPLGAMDQAASSYFHQSQEKAAVAFVAARSLNAALSVLKSFELNLVFVGVNPLQIVEPIDDLSKDFSQVMVYAISALFVQDLAHKISMDFALKIGVPMLGAIWLLTVWTPASMIGARQRLSTLSRSLLMLIVFFRFLVPFTGWLGSEISEKFLSRDLEASLQSVQIANESLDSQAKYSCVSDMNCGSAISPDSAQEDGGLMEWFQKTASTVKDGVKSAVPDSVRNVPDVAKIKSMISDTADHVVNIIKIFIVQTTIIPIGLAAVFYMCVRSLVGRNRMSAELEAMSKELRVIKNSIASGR